MKTPNLLLIAISCLALLQSNCTVRSTAQSRITAYPSYFDKLSESHKTLVQQHRVTEGMSKEAVYLAWGNANEVNKSSNKGRAREIWTYIRYQPVVSRGFRQNYGGYGYGNPYAFGPRAQRWGNDCYYGNSFAYNTDVTYLPQLGARVTFEGTRVVSWETVR